MARHPLLFKGFILLSLSSLHPQAYLKLTVERIEAELSTLYTRPAAEEEEKGRCADGRGDTAATTAGTFSSGASSSLI